MIQSPKHQFTVLRKLCEHLDSRFFSLDSEHTAQWPTDLPSRHNILPRCGHCEAILAVALCLCLCHTEVLSSEETRVPVTQTESFASQLGFGVLQPTKAFLQHGVSVVEFDIHRMNGVGSPSETDKIQKARGLFLSK